MYPKKLKSGLIICDHAKRGLIMRDHKWLDLILTKSWASIDSFIS